MLCVRSKNLLLKRDIPLVSHNKQFKSTASAAADITPNIWFVFPLCTWPSSSPTT